MNKTLRIISLVLLVLSVAFFLASLTGIVLTWIYNQRLTDEGLARLGTIESDLLTAQADLQGARAELVAVQGQIDALQSALDTLGLEGAEDIQAIADLVGKLEDTLVPFITAVAERIEGFRDVVLNIKETIEKLNELPLVNLEVPGVEQLEQAAASLQTLYDQIVEGQDRVSQVSTLTQDTIKSLTTGFASLETSAQTLTTTLTAYDAKMSAYQVQIDGLQAGLPVWIDQASIILTIMLVWLAFSQAALFVVAWQFYSGQDLLKRWRTDEPSLLSAEIARDAEQ